MTNFLIASAGPGWIAVSKLHFDFPGLAAALTELNGRDGSDAYVFPADRRDEVAAILDTTERIPHRHRALEDAEAARYGLVREENLADGSHPLGHHIGTVPGGTVYAGNTGDGTVTIYDRS